MAEVPGAQYEPYFTAQPTERPIQLREVNAPAAAFGENIANAVNIFGGDIEKAGNEVFDRALALRRLQVEGQMRDLTTEYYQTIAPKEEDFLKRQGMDASQDALNAHVADIGQTQSQFMARARQVGGLYGANQFGNEAASMTRNFIQNATRHSSAQFVVAQDQSIDSQIAAKQDEMHRTTDPARLKKLTDDMAVLETQRGGIHGSTPDTVNYKTYTATSKGIANSVRGAILRDPENGAQAGQAALDSGKLSADDADSVVRAVQQSTPTAAHQWFNRVYGGQDISLGEKKVSLDRAWQAIGAGIDANTNRGPLVTTGPYAGQQALPTGVMPSNLAPWLKEAGMPAMTPEEFAKDKDAQRQLFNFKFGQFMDQTGNFNDAASMWFTGQKLTPTTAERTDHYHTNVQYIQEANRRLARTASQSEISDAAEARGNSVATTINPDAGEVYRQYVTGRWDQEKARERYARYDLHTQVSEMILQNNYKSYDEFLADPRSTAIVEQGLKVDPDYTRHIANMINSHLAAIRQHTDEEHLRSLYVMYDDNHDKFMEQNPWEDKQLSFNDQVKIARLQGDLHRSGVADPNFGKAFNDLSAMYPNEVPKKADDEEGYKSYKGDLYVAMQAWQEKNKAPLKLGTPEGNKALQEIHQMLMTKDTSGVPIYRETKVPEGFYDAVRRGNPQATDDEVRYEWFKGQSIKYFNDLYAAKKERYARVRGGFHPGAIRGSQPVVGEPDTAPMPTKVEEDPIHQFIMKQGGKAVMDWIQKRAKEVATGATTGRAGEAETGEQTVREAP